MFFTLSREFLTFSYTESLTLFFCNIFLYTVTNYQFLPFIFKFCLKICQNCATVTGSSTDFFISTISTNDDRHFIFKKSDVLNCFSFVDKRATGFGSVEVLRVIKKNSFVCFLFFLGADFVKNIGFACLDAAF